ncbi:MAG TPA: lantibiotic dehydratase [Pseudonocardiaceae bacterium]|nr:lantibiotic dehydratase [Pseudonocardiaceae bacterium]
MPVLARVPLLATRGEGRALLGEGMFLASRILGEHREPTARSQHTDRAYELRARWRPTPNSVFAGVTLADVVNGPARLHLGTEHRVRSNPSAAWLSATCAALLRGPDASEVLAGLTVTTEPTAVHRGARWEVESEPAAEHRGVQRCTVRATTATDLIMAVSVGGAAVGAVVAAVCSRWPQAREQVVLATIMDLIGYGFLITDLLTGDVSTDPIGRLLTVLPATHPARPPLAEMRAVLAAADAAAPGQPERLVALGTARELADKICHVNRPLTVDVALDARIDVPAALVTDTVRAAGVLWRTATRHDPAAEFHRRFAARYGHHRYVPLLDAADPITGIDTQVEQTPVSDAAGRTAVLGALIAEALANHAVEVELDETTIAALTEDDAVPPQTADVYVRVVADHASMTGQVDLRGVITGCVSTAGSTLARFASLLGHQHIERDRGEALTAELAVRPRSVSAQTLALPAGFATYRIPIGVPGGKDHDLPLTDLLLLSDGTHVTVWSATLERQVVPVLYTRLAARLLPPVARLLDLLGRAGGRPWHTWSWGAGAHWPFQPRVRYRNTILSSARWTFPQAVIDAAGDADRWRRELDKWRTCVVPAPPSTVLTDDMDRWLPLALDHDIDRELLRRYVRRGVTAVVEPPGGAGAESAVVIGPHGPHVAELVIPVMRRADPPPRPHRAVLPARVHGAGLFHPGGPWLSLAVPTAPHLQDELLRGLADLVEGLAEHWDTWFWLRYRTPELGHHLRVRFHGHADALAGRVLPAFAAWAETMTTQRLIGRMVVESYEQETERYGGPDAIERAERVFAADSRLVLALLPEPADRRITTAAHIAAVITRTIAGGDRAALTGGHLDRIGRHTMDRLRPVARAADTAADKPGDRDLFAALHASLIVYRAALPAHLRAACASSLIHMHANRALVAAEDEALVRALARDLIGRAP